MSATKIEYLDRSWNPIAMRCTPCSPGCAHCWHLAMCKRHAANPTLPKALREARGGGKPVLLEDVLTAPLRWRKPQRIGPMFMGDIGHPDIPFEWLDRLFAVMALTPQHGYVVLTKRPERMLEYLSDPRTNERTARASVFLVPNETLAQKGIAPELQQEAMAGWTKWPLPNVGGLVTVCNQEEADRNIPINLQTPWAWRGVSIEPMLGPIDFWPNRWLYERDELGACHCCKMSVRCRSNPSFPRLDWVILGGETGPGARPMDLNWARSVRDQCQAAGVPFFFKKDSTGSWTLDGREWREFPK